YGFLNHLPAWLLVFVTGLWGKLGNHPKLDVGVRGARPRPPRPDGTSGNNMRPYPARAGEWAAAAVIILACYACAIALANHWFGRSTAGYYAVTLPTSGLYLWRYAWLWRQRTRLLLLGVLAPTATRQLRRGRKELIVRVGAARDAYADTL